MKLALVHTLIAVAAIACIRRAPSDHLRHAAPSAQVSRNDVTFVFTADPRADSIWPATRLSDRFAGPHWRIVLSTTPALIAAVTVYPGADTSPILPAYSSLAQLVSAARLEPCREEGWVLSCFGELRGTVGVSNGHIVVRIEEEQWVARLGAERPVNAQLIVFRAGRTFASDVRIPVSYK